MSYNGSGTFNINSTGQPVVAGTVITASAFNALTTDLATGLTTAITKDGQTTTTARITFAQGITSSLVTDSSSVSTGSIITAGGAGIAKNLYVGSAVKFVGATSGSVGLQAKAVAGSTTFNLPSADGTSNQAMVTDGSGNLSFATIAATPGGSTTQVQYNNAGAFAGSANMTFSGTALTLANDASISGLTVGKGLGAVSTNTAVGASALAANTTGATNTAVGYQAGYSNTTGGTNTAMGRQALYSNTTASSNSAFGEGALLTNTTGASNSAFGLGTLGSNTTASNNTAVGFQAGYSNTTGTPITAIGYQAGYANTTGANNVFVGYQSGNGVTTGSRCVAVGNTNLSATCTGNENTAIGNQVLTANTTGAINTGMGHAALYSNTTGSNNTGLGSAALFANTTATSNTAVGYNAGTAVTTGSGNTALGIRAGAGVTTGADNLFVGQNAGFPNGGVAGGSNLTTGSNGVYLGYYSSASSTSVVREGVLTTSGSGAVGKGQDTWYINAQSGLSTGGSYYNGANTTTWNTTSDQRLKKNIVDNTDGLDIINKIQVRNFEYRLPEEVTELPLGQAIQKQGVQLGVIAQELQQILPECVKTESTGVMIVDADNLTWYLVNAVKELSARVKQLEGN